MLTGIILLPLLAAIGLTFVPRNYRLRSCGWWRWPRHLLVDDSWNILFWRFDTGAAGYQFVKPYQGWAPRRLGITCRVGVDGVNIGLILMGVIVAFAAVCVSWEIKPTKRSFTFCCW